MYTRRVGRGDASTIIITSGEMECVVVGDCWSTNHELFKETPTKEVVEVDFLQFWNDGAWLGLIPPTIGGSTCSHREHQCG